MVDHGVAVGLMRRSSPKPMLSVTVSQGKTPPSWKMKIRRRSGPCTGSPSTRISPRVAFRKPAMMFKQRGLAAAGGADDADELALGGHRG